MKKTRTPEQKTLRRKAIRKLAEELPDVLEAFGWHGIGGHEIEPADHAEPRLPIELAPMGLEQQPQEAVVNPGGANGETPQEEAPEADDEDDDDDDSDPYDTDPWEVRTAVDDAISSLMKAELMPELKELKKAPSLTTVFSILFGDEHEMTKQVDYFEELIAGYEDRVSMEDLKEAYEVLLAVLPTLRKKARVT